MAVNELGRGLVVLGVVIILVGVTLMFVGRVPWLGRLPGDIHLEREHWSFHFPLVTSLLISGILTLVFYLIGRR